jgi:hypothetical protein
MGLPPGARVEHLRAASAGLFATQASGQEMALGRHPQGATNVTHS